MPITVYDAVNPANIPDSAPAVLIYIDGAHSKWPQDQVARFVNKPHKTITVAGAHPADGVDCERGDLNAEQAAAWAHEEVQAGRRPFIYCSRVGEVTFGWPWVIQEVRAHGIDGQVDYWIADQTGTPHMVTGAVACQYADVNNLYDLSLADEAWMGATPQPTPTQEEGMFVLNPTQDQFNATMRYVWYSLRHSIPTLSDFADYWATFNAPTTSQGWNKSWDLMVAKVHDSAPQGDLK